jgi:hypothetical protein
MHLPLCPGMTFEAGRLHTLLADPIPARFAALCICPEGSILAGRLERPRSGVGSG